MVRSRNTHFFKAGKLRESTGTCRKGYRAEKAGKREREGGRARVRRTLMVRIGRHVNFSLTRALGLVLLPSLFWMCFLARLPMYIVRIYAGLWQFPSTLLGVLRVRMFIYDGLTSRWFSPHEES